MVLHGRANSHFLEGQEPAVFKESDQGLFKEKCGKTSYIKRPNYILNKNGSQHFFFIFKNKYLKV